MKRGLEEADDEDAKRVHVEEEEGAADVNEDDNAADEVKADAEKEDEDDGEEGEKADEAAKEEVAPVKLGFKTFTSGSEACSYFKSIMASASKGVNMNEYEYRCLLDLLMNGHPDAPKKIGKGLVAFQVRDFDSSDSSRGATAFYAIRKDGTIEDFSYLKCCQKLFPNQVSRTIRPSSRGGGGRSGGVNKGGGFRGRGGGRGRGRGRGRR